MADEQVGASEQAEFQTVVRDLSGTLPKSKGVARTSRIIDMVFARASSDEPGTTACR